MGNESKIDTYVDYYGAASPELEDDQNGLDLPMNSTKNDASDMRRLGKQQELKRNFRKISMISFTLVIQATWEFVIVSLYQGLSDGGFAGMVWSTVWTAFGFFPIVLSLAEMASMAPTSGGQYHWVSEFAPESCQRFLSYLAGWFSTLSWQAGNAAGPFVTGTIIQGLIFIDNKSYDAKEWQGTLLVIANTILVFLANVFANKWIPPLQNAMGVIHVVVFIVFVAALWTYAEHQPASVIFTDFQNFGGWSSTALAVMIGQISAIYGCIGSDAAAHMAEETREAGISVPVAMVSSYIVNAVLGFIAVVTICFAIPNLSDALNDRTGFQFLYAFRENLSHAWTFGLTAGILVVIFVSNVDYLASCGRETWAFARDDGFPFSKWISEVHPTLLIPLNSLILTTVFSIILSFINIGSSVAFYAIVSLNLVALMATYSLSIGCILWRRIYHPETLPRARWSLGRWGIPVNLAGMVYGWWCFFWAFWPSSTPVHRKNFNWSVVMFATVVIVALVLYVVRWRKIYRGPVAQVEGRKAT